MVLVWILLATVAAGILSVLAAAVIAFTVARRGTPYLVSYAVGVLLGAAFLDLIPEAVTTLPPRPVRGILLTTVAGIFACFVLEKLTRSRRAALARRGSDLRSIKPAGLMILVGGGLHNFTDGALLAAAFMIDAHLGVVTTLAVCAHEIPREMGDFGVLIDSGLSLREALFWNVIFSLAAIAGGVVGFAGLSIARPAIPYVVALAAGSFIYIAIADLLPALQDNRGTRGALVHAGAIASGVASMAFVVFNLH